MSVEAVEMNNMARQLSLFSYMKNPQTENIQNVKITLCSLITNVVENEQKAKKNSTDYSMTTGKLQLWPKDEKFQFLDNPGDKPLDSGKKILWISTDCTTETFSWWVCAKHPSIRNNNKASSVCSLWHRNYLMHPIDEKHKVTNIVVSYVLFFSLLHETM